jgi:hypothetical protein
MVFAVCTHEKGLKTVVRRLYIGAWPNLEPNPIDQYLGPQLGLSFPIGSSIGPSNIKPLDPSDDSIWRLLLLIDLMWWELLRTTNDLLEIKLWFILIWPIDNTLALHLCVIYMFCGYVHFTPRIILM